MGTTRKNAIGLPTSLTDVLAKDKEAKKDDRKKQPLAYNSVLAIVMHKCLCFLWQDNNSVLAVPTAHSLHQPQDRVQRERKRPSSTSTNAKQAYACFEGQSKKELSIPVPIDDYNHGMNGVDIASQIQRGFSIHQLLEERWWRPLFYWIVDVCSNNAYLMWKTTQTHIKGKKHHQRFIDLLIEQMLSYSLWTPAPLPALEHHWQRLPKLGRCAWGRKTPGGCVQGDKKERTVLGRVSGNARVTKRPRQVRTGCKLCGVPLCIDRDCWNLYYASNTCN